MMRDDPTAVLIGLIQRVPILAVEAESDAPAIAYQRAIRAWQREAAEVIAEARLSSPAHGRHTAPDAFARAAVASALAHGTAE
ncbi:hypothetical protein ASG32_30665 [Methylobacterium sp. Leaf361]|uniref:hypothetical protein n=1 Tax=Methylobacterium sp. Leaf361 TaxID=1736352 RepID=UPI0006F25824|nr:hypothetical protein [Methylobacterium sp. Leaf361]KQS66490.1 hypothetical protein ASG32_30665 [Methylobacterium sp. Leaf361]